MLRLLLVRHGETQWNAQSRYQGQTDVSLSKVGKRQAMALSHRLAHEQIDVIHTSDLIRARETASILAEPHRLALIPDTRLREIDFGEWEGLTFAEVEQRYTTQLKAWLGDPLHTAPPGGETGIQFERRLKAVLDDLIAVYQNRNVVVVAHGGSLRVLLCLAMGFPSASQWQFRLSNASLSELHLYEDTTALALLNDKCHLA